MNFAYRRPAHYLDTFLAAVGTGLLLGIKYYVLLLIPVLFLVAVVHSWRSHLRKGVIAIALFLVLWLAACAPSLYWYLANWHDFGNPVWPFTVSIGPLHLPGVTTVGELQGRDLPAEIRHTPQWQQIWTSWMENVSTYDYGSRLAGFGPLWVILGLPAIVGWLLLDRRALPLVLVCAGVLLLHTHPWWTRHVLLLPGLGGIALAVLLSRSRPVTRWVAQTVFLVAAVYSIWASSNLDLLHYFLLPPAYRSAGYYSWWLGKPVYRWFEANSRQPGVVYSHLPQGWWLLAPLVGDHLEHTLLPLDGAHTTDARWFVGSWSIGEISLLYPGATPDNTPVPDRPYKVYLSLIEQPAPPGQFQITRFTGVVPTALATLELGNGESAYLGLFRVRGPVIK